MKTVTLTVWQQVVCFVLALSGVLAGVAIGFGLYDTYAPQPVAEVAPVFNVAQPLSLEQQHEFLDLYENRETLTAAQQIRYNGYREYARHAY